jgi:NTE family protein
MTDALVISGGVAKGAFAAGALSVLLGAEGKAGGNVNVLSVVGASSGALNSAFAASVLHAGTEVERIGELRSLWLEDGAFGHVFEPSLAGVLALRGLSGESKVMAMCRGAIAPAPGARAIELRLVVANLAGSVEQIGGRPATTFETVVAFGPDTFENADKLESMFHVVTASAAFPGAFVPVPLVVDGRTVQCIDGGAVNNAPLSYALEHPAPIARVFVVSSEPRVAAPTPSELRGPSLLTHLADMLIEERLFRDLRVAYARNEALARLEKVVPDAAARREIHEALGWRTCRPVEIVEIRPPRALSGGMFDGFFSRELREGYLASGEEAARAWLATL